MRLPTSQQVGALLEAADATSHHSSHSPRSLAFGSARLPLSRSVMSNS